MSLQPLHVYRQLLRSSAAAFRNDAFMLQAAQAEIRSKFEESRAVSDAAAQQDLLEEARQAGEFIRSSIVQAACTDRGTYEIKVGEEHVGGVIEEVTPGMKLPRPKKK